MTIGVCIFGNGTMASWHAEALQGMHGVRLALAIGIDDGVAAFAERFGVAAWSTDPTAMDAPDIHAVIVATPSEYHAHHARAALAAGKHVLVEAPMAMNLVDAEAMVHEATARGLVLAVSHPMRLRADLADLRRRCHAGTERIRCLSGQFYCRSPRAPLDGAPTPWVDNLLWHHASHMVDVGLWLAEGSPPSVVGWMGPAEAPLGIPLEMWMAINQDGRFLLFSGSYHGSEHYEVVIVTDLRTYRYDQRRSTFQDGGALRQLSSAKANCLLIAPDFIFAIRKGRPPIAPAASVLPAMQAMQSVQDGWDRTHGVRSIPGRPVQGGVI